MTNAELRNFLEKLPDDAKVIFANHNGKTYSLDRVYPPTGPEKTILFDSFDNGVATK